jgi:hypothetical protein
MDYVKIVILVIALGFILTGVLVQMGTIGNFLSSVEFFDEAWKTTTLFVVLGLAVLAGYYFKFKDAGLNPFAESSSSAEAYKMEELDL